MDRVAAVACGRPWRRIPLVPLLSLCFWLLPASATAAPDESDARAWLARIQSASHGANYQGTMIFIVGGAVSSARVGHYAIGDQTFELRETLDGRQQRVLRHNDDVLTLWPQARVLVIEKREGLGPSAMPLAVEPQALEQYHFKPEGPGRVAGRKAMTFLLEPRDALRYAQRLWADVATGLMLRADVLGVGSAPGAPRPVFETTAFSEVAVGVRPQADSLLQEIRRLRKLEGWRVVRPMQQRTNLDAEGWAVARPVAGFKLAGCVRRGMQNAGDEQPVLQVVFSDGLMHVSLFVEPYDSQRHRSEMLAQQGATGTLMARRGEHWITVVGDVPATTLKMFADALERRRP
ncbi:MAG TPA: MucB/RseB C-terminal domain-containing protein [Rubrivivax sp.]|nr:MucB/RseB C-terminal domain-containing protein [Rubrivivax sp.]